MRLDAMARRRFSTDIFSAPLKATGVSVLVDDSNLIGVQTVSEHVTVPRRRRFAETLRRTSRQISLYLISAVFSSSW